MTLVVANGRDTSAFLVADTMISSPRLGSGIEVSQLKIAFPLHGIAVGFAGDPDIAERDVAAFAQLGDASFRAAKAHFAKAASISQNHYLINFGQTGLVLRCRSSGVDKPQNPWIGDHNAFAAYQHASEPDRRTFAPGPNWTTDIVPEAANCAFKAMNQFRRAIDQRRAQSIGHFLTIASWWDTDFRISSLVTNYADRPSFLLDRLGRQTMLSLGENADYRFVICPPKKLAVSAAVFAFPHGNTAYLYASPGRQFGQYLKTYRLPLAEALIAAQHDTGIEFELHDGRPLGSIT